MKPQAFDTYAAAYDAHFTESNIGKIQRRQVWKIFSSLGLQNQSVLEINCGTGEDAKALARAGHHVTATDASAGMIEVARSKNTDSKDYVSFQQIDFLWLKDELKNKRFNVIFSNFGGLNCISANELKILATDFNNLLEPGGYLFLVIMGRNCWWEQRYFLHKGDSQKAYRRQSQQGVDTAINDMQFKTWYYSPEEVTQIFAPHFKVEKIRPVGLFVPPSYLETFFSRNLFMLGLLKGLDTIFGRFAFLANHADHFVIVLRKHETKPTV
jgi:ubiquinone/menaquinone biosynthesis C-methylase UbiE